MICCILDILLIDKKFLQQMMLALENHTISCVWNLIKKIKVI